MRLGSVRHGEGTRAFVQSGSKVVYHDDVPDVAALLAIDGWRSKPGVFGDEPTPQQLVAPILRPGKTICVGLNYHGHAAEVGKEAPEFPTLFSKVSTALTGPYEDIVLPPISTRYDWEAELAVVIGARASRVSVDRAEGVIAGYTIVNDLSVRDWQNRTSEWFQGKNFDRSTPIGPVVVTPDEFDPAAGRPVETVVNGVVEQSGSTSDLIFSVPALIAYITQTTTLEPGDMIATGTPAGVGFARNPPAFLTSGDELVTRIDGIGELANHIRIPDTDSGKADAV